MKRRTYKIILPEPALKAHGVENLCRADVVLHTDTVGGYESVVLFLEIIEFSSLGFIYGHVGVFSRLVTLISSVLEHGCAVWEMIHLIRHGFIMGFATHRLAHEEYETHEGGDHRILACMLFLLSTVFIFLFFRIHRSGDLTFCAIVNHEGKAVAVKPPVDCAEFLVIARGCDASHFQRLTENVVQTVDPLAAFGLVHPEVVAEKFLCHVVLEEIKYEIQPVLITWKRTGLVYDRRAYAAAEFAVELVVTEIIIVRVLEPGKKLIELLPGHAGECPESCGAMLGGLVTHMQYNGIRLVRVCAHNLKILNRIFSIAVRISASLKICQSTHL